MHVFGAPARYSVPALRSYTPQEASLASWRRAAGAVRHRSASRTLDLTNLLDRLAEAAGEQVTFARILVANPACFYRFRSRGPTDTG
jgi:hypothetical protein